MRKLISPSDLLEYTKSCTKKTYRGLIQAAFDIDIPILGTLIWVCPDLIFSETETTVIYNPSFLIKSAS